MTAKDSDLVVIRDLDLQLKEYKRKYEQAKTELRSVKGKPTTLLSKVDVLLVLFQQRPSFTYRLPSSTSLMTKCLSLLMAECWTYT